VSLYTKSSIDKIKNISSDSKVFKSVFTKKEILELIDIEAKSVDTVMVDRPDSRKTKVDWSSRAQDIVMPKLESLLGYEVKIGDFPAHFIINRYPLRVHVDMGKDPDTIPHKNILIPLRVEGSGPTHTILFKRRWYDTASLFTSDKASLGGSNDYTFKDVNGKFIYVSDSSDFLSILKSNRGKQFEYCDGLFLSTDDVIGEIEALLNQKRYQQRTSKHITNTRPFDTEIYKKYLTHQPYDDLTSLEVDKIIEWVPGDVIVFDRTTLHCASNFLKEDVREKMAMVMFTVWDTSIDE
tara:strand:- start:1501 stop:2385 length:885 start_codon:yes stop_codon:yes gene_type:complete